MSNETRDVRLSVDQIRVLNAVLMKTDPENSFMQSEIDELLYMFLDCLNSDSETLNDFTA
jgi:hypothetical protein